MGKRNRYVWAALTILVCGPTAVSAQTRSGLTGNLKAIVPEGAGPFPAVLWVSGCSGFFHPRAPWHYIERSEALIQRGFAVFFVDYVRAHGVETACLGVMSNSDVATYVAAAVDSVSARADVKDGSVVLLGASLGGGGVLEALVKASADMEAVTASAVVLYPSCGGLQPWQSRIPVLMLLAGSDQITPPSECRRVVDRLEGAASVEVHSYPDAHHGFDVQDLPTELEEGLPALAFDPEAAADAWLRILRFIGPN